MLPWTASKQVRHASLIAAVEQETAVLVGQWQGLQLLHQLAGKIGAGIHASPSEDCGDNRGPCRKETFRGVLQLKIVCYGSGSGCVL
jgi:hypothetical protein